MAGTTEAESTLGVLEGKQEFAFLSLIVALVLLLSPRPNQEICESAPLIILFFGCSPELKTMEGMGWTMQWQIKEARPEEKPTFTEVIKL